MVAGKAFRETPVGLSRGAGHSRFELKLFQEKPLVTLSKKEENAGEIPGALILSFWENHSMKCVHCGTINEHKNMYCGKCGASLPSEVGGEPTTQASELYGREVDLLFFLEKYTGKISGIVNPSEDQFGRYREGIRMRFVIEPGSDSSNQEEVGALLSFIRQGQEYLGEKFDANQHRGLSVSQLKKEYLRLFERMLLDKEKRDLKFPAPPQIKS